ncbi:MAG: transporter [Candidatus Omnitrophota bacterium]
MIQGIKKGRFSGKGKVFVIQAGQIGFCAVLVLTAARTTFAAHPLITDDAGTVGKGKVQLELNTQFDFESEGSVKEESSELAVTLCFGLNDKTDLVFGIPYQWITGKENGVKVFDENGFGDAGLELKWRFFEKNGWSLALKPGFSISTGDKDKGLGTGKVNYSLYFITTFEKGKTALHFNAGYGRNENDFDEEEDLWHLSLATETGLTEKLALVVNIGAEKNPDKEAESDPVFLLAGFIYSLTENTSVDFGFKVGLNDEETDQSFLAGLTWCF